MGIYQTSYTEGKLALEIIRIINDDCADLLTTVDNIAKGRKECHTSSEFVTKKVRLNCKAGDSESLDAQPFTVDFHQVHQFSKNICPRPCICWCRVSVDESP